MTIETDQEKDYRYVGDLADYALIEELKDRGALFAAYRMYMREHPWWHRFKIGDKVWGLSFRWFAFCPWNGDTAWINLPYFYFGAGTMNVEMRLGSSKYGVTFDIRWRWE